MKLTLFLVFFAILLPAASVAVEEEAPEETEELPNVVLQAFEIAYPYAKIIGSERDDAKEQIRYEIEASIEGQVKYYIYLEDGRLEQIEEDLPVDSLPEEIRQAVNDAYPGSEIEEAERITRGSEIEYELDVESAEQEYELVIAADGSILSSVNLTDEGDQNIDEDSGDDEDDDY